jgi:hypothetical protein
MYARSQLDGSMRSRTAMAAMRHSRIELTMNYYTDPVVLGEAGVVDALPAFGASMPEMCRQATGA